MNKIFLIGFSLTLSIPAFAASVSQSEVNDCNRTVFTSLASCQESKSNCLDLPISDPGICGIYKIKNLHSLESVNEESCLGESCFELLQNKVCSVNHSAFINEDFTGVYCREIIGKEIVIDEVLHAEKLVQISQETQINLIISNGRKARESCEKVLDLIGGFNLMSSSGSQAADQMVSTFSSAKQFLSDGRPGKAKYAIQQIPVGGVVSQQMKDLALALLQDYEAVP